VGHSNSVMGAFFHAHLRSIAEELTADKFESDLESAQKLLNSDVYQ